MFGQIPLSVHEMCPNIIIEFDDDETTTTPALINPTLPYHTPPTPSRFNRVYGVQFTITVLSVFLLFCNVSLQDYTWFLPDCATRLPKFAVFEKFIWTMILLWSEKKTKIKNAQGQFMKKMVFT